MRLVCFPPAGGSSATFRPWRVALAPEFEVVVADLPARAGSRSQVPAESLVAAADAFADRLPREEPYALVGHSLGGLLAYEVARRVAARDLPPPAFVLVAGTRPPHSTEPAVFAPMVAMDDDDLIGTMADLGAVVPLLRDSPARGLFLPPLRADLALIAGYVPDPDPVPIPFDLVAWVARDDLLVPPGFADLWSRYTTGAFTRVDFPGDHFFVYADLKAVADRLRDLAAPVT